MHKLKVRANHTVYIIFAVLSLFSLTLIFNDNIWFDEAYTLSLIQHNYSDIINILKSDMHPPLYFLSLKTFCCIFGYSITATKNIFGNRLHCNAVFGMHNHKKALRQ